MDTMINERGVEYVKVADPKKPGDYLWLARAAFDPSVHQEFGADPQGTATLGVTATSAAAPSAEAVAAGTPPQAEGDESVGGDAQSPALDATDGSLESSDLPPAEAPGNMLDPFDPMRTMLPPPGRRRRSRAKE